MKRKLFPATALYGAMLLLLTGSAFTACTKDYDDDLRIQRELIETNEQEMRDALNAYQTQVDNLLTQLELAYKNADAQQQIEIDAAKAKLTELSQALKTAEANISNLSANFEAFKVAVEADFKLVDQQIQAINARIDGVENKIDGIDNRLKEVETSIAEMEAFRTATEQKLEEMKNAQDASAEAIAEIETWLNEIDRMIERLIDEHDRMMDYVSYQDQILSDKIDNVDTNLRDLIAALGLQMTNMNTTLTGRITELAVAFSTLEGKTQKQIDAAKAELTQALDAYKAEIDAEFEQIDGQIADINGSIESLTDRMDTVEADIAALKGRIQSIRWAPTLTNRMLWVRAGDYVDHVFGWVKMKEEVYLACNDPKIVEKITAENSPYTVEVVANKLQTRAIIKSPFYEPIVAAGSVANTLLIELHYIDTQGFSTYYANLPGQPDPWDMNLQIALKITDDKGNITMSDFADVCCTVGNLDF